MWGLLKKDSVAEAIAKVQAGEHQQLDEAAVSTVAKAHGFVKQTSGMDKGSYKHPKTGETITPLRGGQEYGHSRKDGSTVASFKHKDSLEGHLAKHGYVKEECIEDYSLEELQEFMVSEDYEQLDELSKTTLGNYIKKAANDKADTAFHRGYSAYNNSDHKPYSEPMRNKVHKGQENRNKGIKRAVNKLTRESVEQIEEGWDDMLKSVKDKNGPQPNGGSGKKQGTRYGGGKQKEDESEKRKEKNESVEQIDELSKTTLNNYVDAAKQDNKDHADSRRSGDEHEAKWAKDRMVKRSTGMGAAKQRLNKESTMDEEVQKDIVKMGAKEIKHANVKDKQNDQEVMEPHSQGEADFLDKHSVEVTDDPAADGSKTGADKLKHATEPKGNGAGKYDGKNKTGVKESTDEEGSDKESIDEACGTKAKGKKTFNSFKKEMKS